MVICRKHAWLRVIHLRASWDGDGTWSDSSMGIVTLSGNLKSMGSICRSRGIFTSFQLKEDDAYCM